MLAANLHRTVTVYHLLYHFYLRILDLIGNQTFIHTLMSLLAGTSTDPLGIYPH